MKYQLTLLNMCLTDYFQGHSKPYITIPVWKDMTRQELSGCITEEYNAIYEHLTWEDAWPDLSDRQMRILVDNFILTEQPFINDDIPTLEECSVEMDSVSIYITCEEVENDVSNAEL